MTKAKAAPSSTVKVSLPAYQLKLWRVYVLLSPSSHKDVFAQAVRHLQSQETPQDHAHCSLSQEELMGSMQVGIQGETYTQLKRLSKQLRLRLCDVASLAVLAYLNHLQSQEAALFMQLQRL